MITVTAHFKLTLYRSPCSVSIYSSYVVDVAFLYYFKCIRSFYGEENPFFTGLRQHRIRGVLMYVILTVCMARTQPSRMNISER